MTEVKEEPKKPEFSRGKFAPVVHAALMGQFWRIFIREQSDSYWLTETYPTEATAMAARKEIKEGPLGGSYMVMVYDPEFKLLTES